MCEKPTDFGSDFIVCLWVLYQVFVRVTTLQLSVETVDVVLN
jgi:hypothetical protein